MISARQIKKVVEGAGYKLIDLERGGHFKITVMGPDGRTAKVSISNSPRSQSHWPVFVLADIKRKMR